MLIFESNVILVLDNFVVEYEKVMFNMVLVINRVCNKEGMGYGCILVIKLSDIEGENIV